MLIALRHTLAALLLFAQGFEDDPDQEGLPATIQAARELLAPPLELTQNGRPWTPGPWLFHEQGDACHYFISSAHRWVLGFQFNGEFTLSQELANAQLMACAPSLYDALEALCRAVELERDVPAALRPSMFDARAALAMCHYQVPQEERRRALREAEAARPPGAIGTRVG